jgi:putative sterol carrier protein
MTTAEDALLIFSGKMDPMTAYTFGKLKFWGNVSLAMKMMNYFKMPR